MLTIRCLIFTTLLACAFIYGNEEQISFCQNYSMQNSFQTKPNHWDFFADVLLWKAQETCSDWAFVVAPPFSTPPAAPITGSFEAVLKDVSFNWNVGLRTGVSYSFEQDRLDTRLCYTWYSTSGTSHLHPPPGQVIQSQFIAIDFLLTLPSSATTYKSAKIKWDISFNMFNWNIGRIFYLGKNLSLRPYLGLQGGWIHQHVSSQWFHSSSLFPYNIQSTIKHHFWGIGPDIGVNSKWNLWKNFQHALSVYGDFGQVFMSGHWFFNEVAHTTANVTTINTQPDRTMGSLTFQNALGFAWDTHFNKNRALFTFKVGYELQLWTQQLQFFQIFSGILHNALILQGLTGRLEIEF